VALVNFQAPELLIILAVVLLLFGSTKLPALARSLGQAKKEFQAGTDESKTEQTTPPAS
jgi:sec-independent protein translocase protein TatA